MAEWNVEYSPISHLSIGAHFLRHKNVFFVLPEAVAVAVVRVCENNKQTRQILNWLNTKHSSFNWVSRGLHIFEFLFFALFASQINKPIICLHYSRDSIG